jgi:predicted transcriptional regulator
MKMTEFPNTVKLLRKKRMDLNISQQDLSKSIGVSQQMFSKVESYAVFVPPARWDALCRVLKLSRTEFKTALLTDYEQFILRQLR